MHEKSADQGMVISILWSGVIGPGTREDSREQLPLGESRCCGEVAEWEGTGFWLLTVEEKFVADRISVVRRRRFE